MRSAMPEDDMDAHMIDGHTYYIDATADAFGLQWTVYSETNDKLGVIYACKQRGVFDIEGSRNEFIERFYSDDIAPVYPEEYGLEVIHNEVTK